MANSYCRAERKNIDNFSFLTGHSDKENWLTFNELKRKKTSVDVNILYTKDMGFATQCNLIQNNLNSENNDDILLNHVNSEYYDEKKIYIH